MNFFISFLDPLENARGYWVYFIFFLSQSGSAHFQVNGLKLHGEWMPLHGACILLFGTRFPQFLYLQKDILSCIYHGTTFYRYYSERSWNSKILNIILKGKHPNLPHKALTTDETHSFWWCSSWSRMHLRHLQTVSIYQCVLKLTRYCLKLLESPVLFLVMYWVYSKVAHTYWFSLKFSFSNNQVRDRIAQNSICCWWIHQIWGYSCFQHSYVCLVILRGNIS